MTHAVTPTTEPEEKTRTGPLWWVMQIVSWTLLLVVVAVLLTAVVVPRVIGAQPYTILTQSMEPKYPPGTLVVVRDDDRFGVGTVVTYQIKSGEPDVITHRIVSVGIDQDGKRVYTTRGDNNDVADDTPVKPEQIRGSLWYSIPYLGYVNNWLTGGTRTLVVSIAAGGLLLYAVFQFVGAGVSRRRERRAPS